MRWKVLDGKPIKSILEFVQEASKDGQEVLIGSDSLQVGKETQVVTVVVIYTKSKGGRVAYSRDRMPRIKDLRQRLLLEAQKSLDVALLLAPQIKGELSIHLDVNAQEEHMSSKYVKELVGYVMGMGFKAVIKPDAFVATTVSDWAVRHKGSKKRIA